MSGYAIEVSGLVKVYGEKSARPVRALDGLNLQVKRGEIYGLLGRNGAGKTTLVRILTTLLPSTSGTARVLGWDVQKHPLDVRKSICVVLQENAVELYLSVRDNLATFARFQSIAAASAEVRINHVVEQFGLAPYVHQKVIDLSGGLKRRVQVAKVFMVDKPVVFLDEATTGMDPINKRATLDAIRQQAQLGRTIFLTTHILHEAEELCDSITIIDYGRAVASGSVQTIKSRVRGVFDISMTFDPLTNATLDSLRRLPLVKLDHRGNTVDFTVRAEEADALELVARLARQHNVVHLEVNSATLEDAFLELLGHREPSTRGTLQGGAPSWQ